MEISLSQSGSFFLDRAAAQRALKLAQPLLQRVLEDHSLNQSGVLHVVILDPALAYPDVTFERAILYEASFGRNVADWDADYAGFARAKARLSWETGFDSHVVQSMQPHRLRRRDTALWGSVVLEQIVVGVSGAEAAYDEALAGTIAMLLRGIAKSARSRISDPYLD